MVDKRRRCWSCGASVLHETARRNSGRCRPCAKKGWYGRLWEIVTGTVRRRREVLDPTYVSDLLSLLGVPSGPHSSVESIFKSLESAHVGATIDHSAEPEELWSALGRIKHWQEPRKRPNEQSVERLLPLIAAEHDRHGFRVLNLLPGTDSWFIVIVHDDRYAAILKAVIRLGLPRPEAIADVRG
jgi:hypothetical protein